MSGGRAHALKAKLNRLFFLSGDTKQVSIACLVLKRYRWILGFSLALNLLLMGNNIRSGQAAIQSAKTMRLATEIAQATMALTDLYANQLETLAAAYALYGNRFKGSESGERQRMYRSYQVEVGRYNQRTQTLIQLNCNIRQKTAQLSQLLTGAPKEPVP